MKAVTNVPSLRQLAQCDGDSGWSFQIIPNEPTTIVDSYITNLVVWIGIEFQFESNEPLIEYMNSICSKVPGNKNTFVCLDANFFVPIDTIDGTTLSFKINDGSKNYKIIFSYHK